MPKFYKKYIDKEKSCHTQSPKEIGMNPCFTSYRESYKDGKMKFSIQTIFSFKMLFILWRTN